MTDPSEDPSDRRLGSGTGGGSTRRSRNEFCCCGPGRKRYLIALLCSLGLTVVIGMRAEMVAIMDYLNKRGSVNSSFATVTAASASVATAAVNHAAGGGSVELVDKSAASSSSGSSGSGSSSSSAGMFQPSTHRQMPWQNLANDLVENSLFIGYLVASPLGGYLTVHHDSSLLLGCSVALTCGLNLFLPLVTQIAANISASIAIIVLLRLLQGLAEGCLIPAVFGTLRFWGPETERSSLLCSAVIGVSLGPLIGLPVCQVVENAWGWAVVFYIYANIGLIWCIFWWRLIDEKPPKDQRLGKRERQYLEAAVKKKVLYADRRICVPWKEIFKSRPVYAIFFTYAADDWTFQISSVCMQSYYHQMYNTDIERTIFLLSFPFLARSLFVPIGGFLADFIKLKTNLNWTTIRKIFAGLGFGLKAFFFVALGFANDAVVATILLSLALGFSGLAVAGYAVNVMELAPNFCGLVMGFANSISTFTGMMSTVIAALIVRSRDDRARVKFEWQIALSSAAASQVVSGLVYLLFASAEEQSWTVSRGPASELAEAGGPGDDCDCGDSIGGCDDDACAGGGGVGGGDGQSTSLNCSSELMDDNRC